MTLYQTILNGFNSRTLPLIIPICMVGIVTIGGVGYGDLKLKLSNDQRLAKTPYVSDSQTFKAEIAELMCNDYRCENPSLASGDLTGDGLEDIALAYPNQVLLLQNEGSNKFSKPKRIITFEYELSKTPSISISDVNRDSLKDVIVSDSSRVLLYLNNGLNIENTVAFKYGN